MQSFLKNVITFGVITVADLEPVWLDSEGGGDFG